MIKISSSISIKKAKALIKQLPLDDKIKLLRELEKETWAKKFQDTVSKIRNKFQQNPLSDKEITRICEQARQEIYDAKTQSRHR